MKYLGIALLIGGFIAIGMLRIVLPGITGTEIGNYEVSFDPLQPTTVTFKLSPEDAPAHIILEEMYFADSSLHYTSLTANNHVVTLSGPGFPLDDIEVSIKPSHWADDNSLEAGPPYIANASVALLRTVEGGEFVATVYADQDRTLSTRAMKLFVRANVFTPHRYAELAAFAACFAGIAILIMVLLRKSKSRQDGRSAGTSVPRGPRFGRKAR